MTHMISGLLHVSSQILEFYSFGIICLRTKLTLKDEITKVGFYQITKLIR